jgi:hypothetical protein
MEGETITHKYTKTGSYEVKIVALSGGVAKTTTTQTVVIAINFTITFETVPAFGNFGGAFSVGANNPSIDN